jgi:hypothetical protein
MSAGGGSGDKRLATGDLNGDRLTDLGILNVFSGTVVTVRGDDGRTFTPVTQIPSMVGADREDLVFADLDGDGLDDLVHGEYHRLLGLRDIVLSIGDGEGGFDFQGRFEALGAGARHLFALHLSEDEEVDVATDGGIFLGTALTLEPAVVAFPTRRVGSTGSPLTVVVKNEGTVAYDVADSGLLGDARWCSFPRPPAPCRSRRPHRARTHRGCMAWRCPDGRSQCRRSTRPRRRSRSQTSRWAIPRAPCRFRSRTAARRPSRSEASRWPGPTHPRSRSSRTAARPGRSARWRRAPSRSASTPP